jgi:hypothetical protein
MYYNPETDRALRNIEDTIEAGRKAMEASSRNVSNASIQWDAAQGRWVPKPNN